MNCFAIKKFQLRYTIKKTNKNTLNPPSLTDSRAHPAVAQERKRGAPLPCSALRSHARHGRGNNQAWRRRRFPRAGSGRRCGGAARGQGGRRSGARALAGPGRRRGASAGRPAVAAQGRARRRGGPVQPWPAGGGGGAHAARGPGEPRALGGAAQGRAEAARSGRSHGATAFMAARQPTGGGGARFGR